MLEGVTGQNKLKQPTENLTGKRKHETMTHRTTEADKTTMATRNR